MKNFIVNTSNNVKMFRKMMGHCPTSVSIALIKYLESKSNLGDEEFHLELQVTVHH